MWESWFNAYKVIKYAGINKQNAILWLEKQSKGTRAKGASFKTSCYLLLPVDISNHPGAEATKINKSFGVHQ